MKIKDISAEWQLAQLNSSGELGDNPNDLIDWKEIRSHGYYAVSIDGRVYKYCKYGLLEELEYFEQK